MAARGQPIKPPTSVPDYLDKVRDVFLPAIDADLRARDDRLAVLEEATRGIPTLRCDHDVLSSKYESFYEAQTKSDKLRINQLTDLEAKLEAERIAHREIIDHLQRRVSTLERHLRALQDSHASAIYLDQRLAGTARHETRGEHEIDQGQHPAAERSDTAERTDGQPERVSGDAAATARAAPNAAFQTSAAGLSLAFREDPELEYHNSGRPKRQSRTKSGTVDRDGYIYPHTSDRKKNFDAYHGLIPSPRDLSPSDGRGGGPAVLSPDESSAAPTRHDGDSLGRSQQSWQNPGDSDGDDDHSFAPDRYSSGSDSPSLCSTMRPDDWALRTPLGRVVDETPQPDEGIAPSQTPSNFSAEMPSYRRKRHRPRDEVSANAAREHDASAKRQQKLPLKSIPSKKTPMAVQTEAEYNAGGSTTRNEPASSGETKFKPWSSATLWRK